ncbi:MAG: type II toxin-antitoxin system VapC family toxin [Coriobacteriia bacterium]|nr:type II toxin-antitoxin system VapC family toxin [Coriobacteriia bacterium]
MGVVMYVLDSCICIELMRGRLPLTYERMRQCPPSMFAIPHIVEAELLTGAEKSANSAKVRLLTERFLQPFPRLAFDSNCARSYARVRADLERRGVKIGPNDLIIAASAVANNATVVTRNVREFARVTGLQVEDWEEAEL